MGESEASDSGKHQAKDQCLKPRGPATAGGAKDLRGSGCKTLAAQKGLIE